MNTHKTPQYTLERAAYDLFRSRFERGEYAGQRFGQAFYNYFKIHEMRDERFASLYEADGTEAISIINQLFQFH